MFINSISFNFILYEMSVEMAFSLSAIFQLLGGIIMKKNNGQVNARVRDDITNRNE